MFHRIGDYGTASTASAATDRRAGVPGAEGKDKDRVRKCRVTAPGRRPRRAHGVKPPTELGRRVVPLADRRTRNSRRSAASPTSGSRSWARPSRAGAGDLRPEHPRATCRRPGNSLRCGAAQECCPACVVCEFKFRVALPTILKEVVAGARAGCRRRSRSTVGSRRRRGWRRGRVDG